MFVRGITFPRQLVWPPLQQAMPALVSHMIMLNRDCQNNTILSWSTVLSMYIEQELINMTAKGKILPLAVVLTVCALASSYSVQDYKDINQVSYLCIIE